MRSFLLAAGLACLWLCASACRPAHHEIAGKSDPRPEPVSPTAPARSTTTTPNAATPSEDAESPFAPMVRGTWRDDKGTHTFVLSVTGSRFFATELYQGREIGRYEGRLIGRRIVATYVSRSKGPVDGSASLELSNDGIRLAGAFTHGDQLVPMLWIRN